MGDPEEISVKEFGRECGCPSVVRVFARKHLFCSDLTPRAGLRSVRRVECRPRPTVG